MIKVYVKKQSNYPVSASDLKKRLKSFLQKKGIVSDCVVGVSLVGEKKMRGLSKKYLGDNELHNVLSFSESEVKKTFVYPPGDYIYLGEIVVCYLKVIEEAKLEEKLIEDKVYELVEHGARHLLGEHHN